MVNWMCALGCVDGGAESWLGDVTAVGTLTSSAMLGKKLFRAVLDGLVDRLLYCLLGRVLNPTP